MLSSSSSVFDNLPTRPPTPPRDISTAVEDAISFLDDSNEIERALKSSRGVSTDTPTHPSPPSSQEVPTGSNAAKKVGFTPRPIYHQIAPAGQQSSPSALLRKCIPSRRHAKPVKSILKQSNVPSPLTPDDLDTKISFFSPELPGSFARMLQSVIQQLAGQSVTARLDAYLALNGALKAYEGIPDHGAMVAKMSLIMQFITRDMAWKNDTGALDVNIATQAMKLTAAILYDPKLSTALDDDFRYFLVDRSVAVMEHADMPKAVIRIHMYLLAQQRFQSHVMTVSRSERIISSLQSIEQKCSGNSSIASRLVIYQRLLEQRPAVMLNRMSDWLEPVIHGMLSSIKEVRIRAIEMCTQAGLTLGNNAHASKALLNILEHEVEDTQSYCDYLSLRLMQMISEKEVGAYVPQIWSAITFFFRNKRHPLEKWPKFKTWLMIIQRCLNSSDLTVRYQGHLSWDELVFAVMPDSSLGRNMFAMLKVPPKMGMDKKGADPHSKQVRQYALESYYNLLHYALRPGLSHEELDSAWDVYVEPILSGMIKANDKGRYIACGVLHGLCTASTGLWNVNAANEAAAIKPEELPKLEPRWIRSRLAKILTLMEPIILPAMWMAPTTTVAVDATWYALMQSLAEAGSQEVKTSNELKEAIAHLVNLLRRLWAQCDKAPEDAQHGCFTNRYIALLSTAVQSIGTRPLAEDILTKTKEDTIQAALTPSHRSSKHHSAPQSPLVFLFGVLYQTPAGITHCDDIAEVATTIVQLLVSARPSPATSMELLQRSSQIWSSSYATEAREDLTSALWACIAKCTIGLLEAPHSLPDEHGSQTLGLELRNASGIFAQGMRHVSNSAETLEVALRLFSTMFSAAKAEAGVGGTVLAVVEPSAKVIVEADTSVSSEARLKLSSAILRAATWPRSRQELDQARKALWGVGLAPHKSTTFDPFDYVYQLANGAMIRSYNEGVGHDPSFSLALTFDSFLSFLKACPLSVLAVACRKVQQGLVVWLEDTDRKTGASGAVRDFVCSTWDGILQVLGTLPQKDSILLRALESLIAAGFSSPHKPVVSRTIVFWNNSFGSQDRLEYPPRLETILRAWAAETDLILPGFTDADDANDTAALPTFFETQIDAPNQPEKPRTARLHHDCHRVPSTAPVARSTHFPTRAALSSTRPTSSPATAATEVSVRFTPKARLRHDDSQVQFAPIESSPVRFEESQMLTEHQKEVQARQHGNAQMFPDLSSSPATKPSTSSRSIQKRLDFTSDISRAEEGEGEDAGTPIDLPDGEGPMSDDIPSSPTPSSTKEHDSAQLDVEEDDTEADDACDPPSSPPQQADEPEEAAIQSLHEPDEQADADSGADVDADLMDVEQADNGVDAGHMDESDHARIETAPAFEQGSDLPSDTLLPTEQLLNEEEAAAKKVGSAVVGDETEGTTFFNPRAISPEPAHPAVIHDAPVVEISDEESVSATRAVAEGNVTRVEDSFTDTARAEQGKEDDEANVESQQSQRSARKRKRPSYTGYTSKKRKQQSPLKQAIGFFSSFVRRSQEEDEDDDMEDEIVVASSQPSYSPASARAQQATSSPSKLAEVPSESVEEPATAVKEDPTPSQQPQKRGRGRPRKSETPTPAVSQTQPAPSRGLKRRASALSTASATNEPATSFVKETPAPSKSRKARRGPDAKLVETARLSQDEAELGRSTRRTVAAVVVPDEQGQGHADSEENAEKDEEEVEPAGEISPEKQLATEEAAALNERPIVTPRSILGRLRDVLADLPKMILGSQEERELDDVLFQVKREVYEAARRGRE